MQYRTNILRKIKPVWEEQLLSVYEKEEASNILQLLIAHYLHLSKTDQALQPDYRLSESEILQLHFAVKRLMKNEPVQYILGKTAFYGLDLSVNTSVLIPRPETEYLVSLILQVGDKSARILDIGTGSGCIALALKKELPHAMVTGIDVSEEALQVAKQNARNSSLDVHLLKKNILDKDDVAELGNFNIIVSNPPYVTETDKKQMKANVLEWEPDSALFVSDQDPLVFYRAIAAFAQDHLLPDGKVYLEINENFGRELVSLFESAAFKNVQLLPDLNGKSRFISAEK